MSAFRVITIEASCASDAMYRAECEARRITRSPAARTRQIRPSGYPCRDSVGGVSFSVLVKLFGLREAQEKRS